MIFTVLTVLHDNQKFLNLPFTWFYGLPSSKNASEKERLEGKQFSQHVIVVHSLSPIQHFDPMDCSIPVSSVLCYLPDFAQIHVHWVGDAIWPSHPLPPSYPFAFNLSQHQGLFQWVVSLHQVESNISVLLFIIISKFLVPYIPWSSLSFCHILFWSPIMANEVSDSLWNNKAGLNGLLRVLLFTPNHCCYGGSLQLFDTQIAISKVLEGISFITTEEINNAMDWVSFIQIRLTKSIHIIRIYSIQLYINLPCK